MGHLLAQPQEVKLVTDKLLGGDADGQRVMTTRHDGTKVYTPFPDYEVEDPPTGDSTTRTTYRLAGQIVAVQHKIGAAGVYYYTYTDHLGNVVGLSSTGGAFIANSVARFDPFGNYRTTPDWSANPTLTDHGFTGHRHNNTGAYPTFNVGLIYMNARYYMPEVGRFVSADTVVPEPGNPQSFNRYTYALNSPTNFTDPSGHCAVDSSGNIMVNKDGNGNVHLVKTDCTVDDFQALSWEQRQQWLELFIRQYGLSDWFVDIARVIQVFAGDPDYSSMSGWAAYADAAVLQAINDGMRLRLGQEAIGSAGTNGGAAWAEFFRKVRLESVEENELIILRLAGEQGGVDYATSLPETLHRYSALTPRVQDKSGLFLAGANAYRTLGMWCHAGCLNHAAVPGELLENLIVAHTDPRTSGDTRLIQLLAQLPDWFYGD